MRIELLLLLPFRTSFLVVRNSLFVDSDLLKVLYILNKRAYSILIINDNYLFSTGLGPKKHKNQLF